MLRYSPGAFVEVIDLTTAIFKNLTLADRHKELLVLLVGAQTGCDYNGRKCQIVTAIFLRRIDHDFFRLNL